jgi:hypothetical protein
MANWALTKKRALMSRRGTERVRVDSASMVRRALPERSTNDRPPRKSKEELRADAVAAFIAWREKAKAKQVPPCS